MKKKIMILAVAIASMAGFNSLAQVSATATSGIDKVKCDKGKKGECDGKKECKGANPFEGITLTADQQTKIDALKAECKANREKCKAEKRAEKAEKKAEKKAAMEQARAERKQAKRDYLNKVKGILTPDQYVVFLENIVVSDAPQGGPRPGGRPAGKGMKGKDFKRGDRPAPQSSATVAN